MGWHRRLLRQVEDDVRPAIEKRLEAGAVLFRAGDHCPGVALIHDGEVEVWLEDDQGLRRVEVRGRGAFVGDDAVLGAGICRHTVVACRPTRVEMLARDVYLERLAGPAAAGRRAPPTVAREVVWLEPASPECAAAVPAAGMEIAELPFVVGRADGRTGGAAARRRMLLLDDHPPYRLSRRQFAIVATEAGPAVTDPGSRLGTFVDGERLGIAPRLLPPDEAIVISAGGAHSPFRFRLRRTG
jgi:hypothetical protein